MLLELKAYTDSDVMEDMLDIDIVSNFISAMEELLNDASCTELSMWMDFEEKLSCTLLTEALSFLSTSTDPWALEDTDSVSEHSINVCINAFKHDSK